MVKSSKSTRVASPASSVSVAKTGGVRKVRKRPHHRREARGSWCLRRWKKPVSAVAKVKGKESSQGQEASTSSNVCAESNSMEDSKVELEQFMNTGRTGRRNAMPEITHPSMAGLSTADLPMDLAKLSCSESMGAEASTGQAGKGAQQGSNQGS